MPDRSARSTLPRTSALLAALLIVLASPAPLAQLQVPDDYVELQDAIDAASPGEVIVVDGGTYGPLVVDTPLTIVGRVGNRPTLTTFSAPPVPVSDQEPIVRLDGPGSGALRLVNLELTGQTSGLALFTSNAPAITGGGFDELQLVACDAEAPRWIEPFGGGLPEAGIDVDLPFTLVSRCTVIGGYPADDYPFAIPDSRGAPGIRSTGDVAVVDSLVRGGDAREMVFGTHMGFVPLDCDFPTAPTGFGGPAVEAAGTLFTASAQLEAGAGAQVFGTDDDFGDWFVCQVSGSPVLDVAGSVQDLENSLLVGDPLLLPGFDWDLIWQASAPGSVLVVGFDAAAPVQVGPHGLLFAEPVGLQFLAKPATGFGVLSFPVPSLPGAEGLTVVVQRWSPTEGLSHPVVTAYAAL